MRFMPECAMDTGKAFWTAQRRVNFGMSTLNLKLRFETMMVLGEPVVFRLSMSFVDEPASLFTALSKPNDYIRFGLDSAKFPAMFHKLFADQLSVVDIISQAGDKQLLLSVRNSSLPAPHLTVLFQKAQMEEVNSHLKAMLHDMRHERTLIEAELHSLRTENQRMRQQLSVVKHTDKLVQAAFEQIGHQSFAKPLAPAKKPHVEADKLDAGEELVDEAASVPATTSLNPPSPASTSSDLILGIASYLLCAVCEKVSVPAKHSSELSRHFIQAHADDARNLCLACPDETNVLDLMTHAKSHTQRVYACEYCGKKGRKHYLKSHVRTHTGEKPYKCQTCGRSFADQSTIRRHQTTVHSALKRFVCPICGRDISRKDNYRVHLKSHAQDETAAVAAAAAHAVDEDDDDDEEIEVVDLVADTVDETHADDQPPQRKKQRTDA